MKTLPILALALFAADPSVTTSRWQRTITPPPGAPYAAACVTLDADTFSHAAPGLRDLRLFQDGREVQYATDESYDDRMVATGYTPLDDRALYDTVGLATLAASSTADRSATYVLPAHVPIERITLRIGPPPNDSIAIYPDPIRVHLTARPNLPNAEAEEVDLLANPVHLALPVTLGANLQQSATLRVDVNPAPPQFRAIAFEMRRRDLCYQPISASPLLLLLGDDHATVRHSDYAAHFAPAASPLMAALGPVEPNPAYLPPAPRTPGLTHRQRLVVACGLAMMLFFVTTFPLLRQRTASSTSR